MAAAHQVSTTVTNNHQNWRKRQWRQWKILIGAQEKHLSHVFYVHFLFKQRRYCTVFCKLLCLQYVSLFLAAAVCVRSRFTACNAVTDVIGQWIVEDGLSGRAWSTGQRAHTHTHRGFPCILGKMGNLETFRASFTIIKKVLEEWL